MKTNRTMVLTMGNNKGGVAKSFSTGQIGAILNEIGYKVLLADFDPQGNLSNNFNLKNLESSSIAEVLLEQIDIFEAIKPTYRENLDLIPSDLRLMDAEDTIKLGNRRSDNRLLKVLNPIIEAHVYDYIIIDNSPSISTLFVNSLTASDYVVIPIECDVNSLEGFSLMTKKINQVKEDSNSKLEILGIFITKAEEYTNLHSQYIQEVKDTFGELVFDTIIPKAVTAGESLFSKQAMIDYDKSHKLTKAYEMLVSEIINRVE